jgi:hypothetical protein
MAKVNPSATDVLYQGTWLTARAITLPGGDRPALAWVESLEGKGLGQWNAALAVVETSLSSSRPTAGRTEVIGTSAEGISELRVTKAGSTPPHLRAFFVREGRTLWFATGITKTKNKLSSREIKAADAIVAEWRRNK